MKDKQNWPTGNQQTGGKDKQRPQGQPGGKGGFGGGKPNDQQGGRGQGGQTGQ